MKFRKKPVVIEAVQWFPGVAVEGVKECGPEIHFSRCRKYYYLSGDQKRAPREWMGVDKLPVTKDEPKGDGWMKSHVKFMYKTEPTHVREVLPFAFYKVKSGDTEPLDPKSEIHQELSRDYALHAGWKEPYETFGIVDTPEGGVFASGGDWIITGVKGEKYPCKPDIFAATYEAAE